MEIKLKPYIDNEEKFFCGNCKGDSFYIDRVCSIPAEIGTNSIQQIAECTKCGYEYINVANGKVSIIYHRKNRRDAWKVDPRNVLPEIQLN